MNRFRSILLVSAFAGGMLPAALSAAAPLPATLWFGTGLNIRITLEGASVTRIDAPAPIIEATLLDGVATFDATPFGPSIDCPLGGSSCAVDVSGELALSATDGRVEASFQFPHLELGIRSEDGGTLTLFVARGGAGGSSPGADPIGVAEVVFSTDGEWKLNDEDDFYFEGPPITLALPAGESLFIWEGLSIDSVAERRLGAAADVPEPGTTALLAAAAAGLLMRWRPILSGR